MNKIYFGAAKSLLLASSVLSMQLFAADEYTSPQTEWQAPDLQGVWSIATQTNLERAQRFDGKLVISSDEATRIESMVDARNEASNAPSDPNREAPTVGQNVGGYNTFWMDPGEQMAVIDGEIRTSILVNPENGRLPWAEGAMRAIFSNRGNGLGEFAGPESRPLGERCLQLAFRGSYPAHPHLPFLDLVSTFPFSTGDKSHL